MISFLALFGVFFKIGIFTFGGGQAMIPLLQKELVVNLLWIPMKEFLDFVAISEITPGPVAINMATFVGYKLRGLTGALVVAGCHPALVHHHPHHRDRRTHVPHKPLGLCVSRRTATSRAGPAHLCGLLHRQGRNPCVVGIRRSTRYSFAYTEVWEETQPVPRAACSRWTRALDIQVKGELDEESYRQLSQRTRERDDGGPVGCPSYPIGQRLSDGQLGRTVWQRGPPCPRVHAQDCRRARFYCREHGQLCRSRPLGR